MTGDGGLRAVANDRLAAAVSGVFASIGCPPREASLIADELVLADRMGLHSHGCARVGEYVEAARSGRVTPGGPCTVAREKASTALVDGGSNFGQVVGRFALEIAAEKSAQTGTCTVVTRASHHVGRLGSIVEQAALRDLVAIATVAVGFPGPVAPWGGAEGVLGTNPFAYAVPVPDGSVVTDFATSTVAEGAVRLAWRAGRPLVDGMILDSEGEPTNDPGALFSDPPGAILPFGGPLGYKGYALNILPELVAAALAGYGADDPTRPSNCLLLVVIDPAAFMPVGQFKELAGQSVRMITGARPRRGERILLPGERERMRLAENETTVALSAKTVDQIDELARTLGVAGVS